MGPSWLHPLHMMVAAACLLHVLATPARTQGRHADVDTIIAATPLGAIVPLVVLDSLWRIHAQYGAAALNGTGEQVVAIGLDHSHLGIVVGRRLPGGGLDGPVATIWGIRVGSHERLVNEGPLRIGVGYEVVGGFVHHNPGTGGSLGVRVPITFGHLERSSGDVPSVIVSSFLSPGIGWGRMRIRGCEDDGPGDNCGALGVQLAWGRTRFLLGGGVRVGIPRRGISLQAGFQRLLAADQDARFAIGASWAP